MTLTLLPSQLELIKTIANDQGINNYELELNSGKQKGDGYSSNIVLVSIKSPEKTLELLIKIASDSVKLRSQAPVRKLFLREIFMYEEVFKHYENIRKSSKTLFNPPKFYGSISDELEECLVFENLKENGFQLWNRKVPMDHDHIDLIIQAYAECHALSFVTRYFYPNKFEKWFITAKNLNKYYSVDDPIKQYKKLIGTIMDLFNNDFIKKKLENFGNDLLSVFKQEFDKKYVVLNHGDCWCNNFLYEYNDSTNSKKPTNVCPIDFQLSSFTSPMRDLIYCIFSNTDKQGFTKYRDYLTKYYDTMGDILKSYNLNIETVYPFKTLEEDWKNSVKYALLTGFTVLQAALVSSEDALDMAEAVEKNYNFMESFFNSVTGSEEYNRRVRDLVNFFVDNNWI